MNNHAKIMDIAMNLNRMGNWAADGYTERKDKIKIFLGNTNEYIQNVEKSSLPQPFKETYQLFLKKYSVLEKQGQQGPSNPLFWAEDMMTWGNILTHRAKLLL